MSKLEKPNLEIKNFLDVAFAQTRRESKMTFDPSWIGIHDILHRKPVGLLIDRQKSRRRPFDFSPVIFCAEATHFREGIDVDDKIVSTIRFKKCGRLEYFYAFTISIALLTVKPNIFFADRTHEKIGLRNRGERKVDNGVVTNAHLPGNLRSPSEAASDLKHPGPINARDERAYTPCLVDGMNGSEGHDTPARKGADFIRVWIGKVQLCCKAPINRVQNFVRRHQTISRPRLSLGILKTKSADHFGEPHKVIVGSNTQSL